MNENTAPELSLSNVIDIRTKEPLMPKKVRAIVMGQYLESKVQEHTPDQFVDMLERRILADMAAVGAKYIKDLFINGGK